jgi:hypothetical protein
MVRLISAWQKSSPVGPDQTRMHRPEDPLAEDWLAEAR